MCEYKVHDSKGSKEYNKKSRRYQLIDIFLTFFTWICKCISGGTQFMTPYVECMWLGKLGVLLPISLTPSVCDLSFTTSF